MKKKKPINQELREELLKAIEGFKAQLLLENEPTNVYCYLTKKDADALRGKITWTEKSTTNKYKIGTLGSYNVKDKLRFIIMVAPELTESKFCAYNMNEQISDPKANVMERIKQQLKAEATNVVQFGTPTDVQDRNEEDNNGEA